MKCDQCQAVSINGVATHETGCPNSWRDPLTGKAYPVECFECGCDFIPEERTFGRAVCPDCANPVDDETAFDHMVAPRNDGRHPQYPHLVMVELEPHHGSYIARFSGHAGDLLLSEDDARAMLGDQFDEEFGYVGDEYLDLLQTA